MHYYKHTDKQFNPLRGCKTLKIGSFDYYRNYEGSDFIIDKNEGKWSYTFSNNKNIPFNGEEVTRYLHGNQIKVTDAFNGSIINARCTTEIAGVKLTHFVKHSEVVVIDGKNYLKEGAIIDINVDAPNTYMFCFSESETLRSNPYNDYYIFDDILFKNIVYNIAWQLANKLKALSHTFIANFDSNKEINILVSYAKCYYYDRYIDFTYDWQSAKKILDMPDVIHYIKKQDYKYQNEVRVIFRIVYDNQIIPAPTEFEILDFPNHVLNELRIFNSQILSTSIA